MGYADDDKAMITRHVINPIRNGDTIGITGVVIL